jgi:hypothetical protein
MGYEFKTNSNRPDWGVGLAAGLNNPSGNSNPIGNYLMGQVKVTF